MTPKMKEGIEQVIGYVITMSMFFGLLSLVNSCNEAKVPPNEMKIVIEENGKDRVILRERHMSEDTIRWIEMDIARQDAKMESKQGPY